MEQEFKELILILAEMCEQYILQGREEQGDDK